MNKSSKLPDFIEVANIKDLFWNNNSDLYPQCVPTGYHLIENVRPVFVTPYVGTCVLDGELNHCLYNGEYYFLTKLEILDIEKLRYKYQLDYDVMMNFLSAGVGVRGTLIKTDRKDILDECLQTTVPILADPVNKRVYGKPNDKTETWQKKLKINLFSLDTIKEKFEEWSITKENYHAFIRRVETNIFGDGTKNKQWLVDKPWGNKYNPYANSSPLFILDSLPINKTLNRWKGLLAYEIAKFFETTKKEDLIITKQTTPSDHFNNGGYVVGKKDHTVGQNIVSEVYLSRIDLSDLTDIVPIENTAKRVTEPNKTPTYDMLPHSPSVTPPPNIIALLRNPYLPIGNDTSVDGCISSPVPKTMLDYCQLGLLKGNNTPQKVITKDGKKAYLWYLNKNNLALIEEGDSLLKTLGCKFSVSTWTGALTRWGFISTEYKNIAPIGFLIYQTLKRTTEWNDLEYIGDGADTIYFRTGLKQSVINKRYSIDADNYWWGHADNSLLYLWGDSDLSKVFLDLDQFNWLSIAPSDKGHTYKWHYYNYWGYKRFFPSASSQQSGYPSVLNRMNIEFHGSQVINPYSYADPDTALPAWLIDRQGKLDAISIYSGLNIDGGVKKGDILTTSIEHGWYDMKELTRLLIPYAISNAEWSNWTSKDFGTTINVGDDSYSSFIKEEHDSLAAGTGTVAGGLAAGILGLVLAPFTVGTSLVISAASASLLAAGSGLLLSKTTDRQFMVSVVSTLPYSNPTFKVDPGLEDGTIVLYLYNNQYRVGIYKKKSTKLTLNDSDDNLISSVDGTTYKDLDLMLIRPLEHGLLDYKEPPVVSDTLKQEIIEYGLGNKDNLTPLDKTHYFTPDDFKNGQYTFDLKGTQWYLYIHNGTINFIPKSVSVFDTVQDEGQLIDIKDDVSTYAKINQKANLNYYGQVFNLNTKFTFKGDFRYISKPIVLENQFADPDVEYKWLMVKEQDDDIDVILTLPRKETRHAEVVDSTQVLMMKERLLQIATNYEQDKYANELMVGDKKLLMARQREDLDWQHRSTGWNIGLKVGGAALGGSLFGKGNPLALAGAVGLAGSTKSDVEFLLRYSTLMKRIDEDEKNLMLANSQILYQRKQNYEHDFKFQTLKLNKIAGSYQKPGVSNRDAQEKYNKERGVANVNVEVYLPSPTQQKQIDYIYETFGCECISDHFEYTPLSIRDNMPPGIYQFSRIENNGIESSITDTTLREILRRILENGVKFQGCHIEIEPLAIETIHFAIPKRPKIVFDPTNIKDWSIDKWDLYKIETSNKDIIDTLKKVPNFGLSDDEWNKHKGQFKDVKDEDLIELLNRVIASREEGGDVVIALPKDFDPTTHKLDKIITDLKGKVTDLETKLSDCKNAETTLKEQLKEKDDTITAANNKVTDLETKLSDCKNAETTLKEQLKEKEGSVNVIQEKVTSLSLEKADLLKKIKDCENQVKQLQQRQDTCDRINTQKIKDLQARIKELETDLEANKTDLAEATKALEDEKDARDKLQKAYDDEKKRLEDEIHNHKVDKEDLTQQLNNERRRAINEKDEINKLKKDKEDLQTKLDAKNKELEDAKKATPTTSKPAYDNCPLMKDLMNDQYIFDVKIRDDGWSAFIDLAIEIATAVKWEGRTQLAQRILTITELHPFLELLEDLEGYTIIDKAIELVQEPGWPKYLKWKQEGGSTNGDVDKVISKFSQLKNYETNVYVKGLKGVLDQMNYEVYKFKTKHWTKYQNNQDVGFLLRHVYPGKALELYKALYGDPNIAITRKRFYDEIKCVVGGTGNSIQILDGFKKDITTEMVTVVPEPPTESKPAEVPKEKEVTIVKPGLRPGINYPHFDTTRYKTKPITTGQRFDIPPIIWWFEDAKKEGGRGKWTINSIYSVEQSGNRINLRFGFGSHGQTTYKNQFAITFWNYPYYRRPKYTQDLWSRDKKVVYFRSSFIKRIVDNQCNAIGSERYDYFNHYMEAIYYPDWGKFRDLWINRNRLIVPDSLLKSIVESKITIQLKHYFLGISISCNPLTREERTIFEVIDVTTKVEFATHKVQVIDEDYEDLIRLLFILDSLRIEPYEAGKDYTDGYYLIGFKGGTETSYYLYNGYWRDGDMFERINTRMASVTGSELLLNLGLFFTGNDVIPDQWKITSECCTSIVPLLQYFRYLKHWGHTVQPHPFELNNGETDKMFKRLDDVKRNWK